MNIFNFSAFSFANLFSFLLFFAVLFLIIKTASWKKFLSAGKLQHLWFATTILLACLWQIKTGIRPGLDFHLLGATLLTLMFGWQFAILSLIIIVGFTQLISGGAWHSMPLNSLIFAILPVLFSYSIYYIIDKKLPNHIFIYIFINAFLGGALTIGLVGLSITILFSLFDLYQLDYLLSQYLPYYILMGWSEAFLTGMIITLMVVYQPQWVWTFDDNRYLKTDK